VHGLDEAGPKRDIVVLNEDLIALPGEDVGDLTRDGCYRAPAAKEEIVALLMASRHRDHCALVAGRWSRRSALAVKECGLLVEPTSPPAGSMSSCG
jgi:hypothetical protein